MGIFWSKRYWKRSDLIATHHFRIWSWMFPSRYTEDKCLVKCCHFSGDCRSIYVIRPALICSEYEYSLFEFLVGRFISMEVIIFIWSYLISSMFFPYVVSDSIFPTLAMLFIIICSYCSSTDVGRLERWFSRKWIVMKICLVCHLSPQ